MQFTAFGGAAEVGASCLLLQVAGKNILMDAGIRVNRSGADALPDLDKLYAMAEDLDLVLISHAHMDHIGALPLIREHYPYAPFYCTVPTKQIAPVQLKDTVKIMEREAEEKSEIPLYNLDLVISTIWAFEERPFGQWFELIEGIHVYFHPAGHILGAACILLRTPEGNIAYTGDISSAAQRTVSGITPIDFFNPEVLITEATYGGSTHPSRKAEEQRLAKSVAEVIEQQGTVLIPSFALGRAQEIILTLKSFMMNGLIPKFPIVADGMVRLVCDTYTDLLEYLPTKLQNYVRNSQQPIFWSPRRKNLPEVIKLEATERPLMLIGEPKCIISSSGMLTGGPSVFYAGALAVEERNAIFLTGYQDEESPGRKLQKLQRGDMLTLDGNEVPVVCDVRRYHLSAHADQMQMCQQISYMEPKQIILLHGEWSAIQALREKLVMRYIVHTPSNGQTLDLDKPPEWISSYRLQELKEERTTYYGQIEEAADGSVSIRFPSDLTQSPMWQQFFKGHQTVRGKFMGKWLHLKGMHSEDETTPSEDDELPPQNPDDEETTTL
ncbi:MAG: MBL fold metallo-hydrolase [Candidatus Poribacteria bacterium]|nr:MBL fold metallo-hydrolase [Candidatus Poribacteria bacterium]